MERTGLIWSAGWWVKCEPFAARTCCARTGRTPRSTPSWSWRAAFTPACGVAARPLSAFLNVTCSEDVACGLKENREPLCTGEDALAALRIALAVRESAAAGRSVRLDGPA